MTSPAQGPGTTPSLEVAHVLFMDIVAYSRLPMEQQHKLVELLQETVRNSTSFAEARHKHRLISLPTGDGMALAFFGDPEAPVRCALELARTLREHPELKLRMGIHSGPVYRVADINAKYNVEGGGINMAQRVMDCGDEGHILVSAVMAEMLGQLEKWQGCIHDLGEAEVKHGVRVRVYNLHTEEAGNPALPTKLKGVTSRALPSTAASTPSGKAIEDAHIDAVTKELATYIGPIARVVVKREAEGCSSVDDLYHKCAVEIDCETDRSRFMASRRRRT